MSLAGASDRALVIVADALGDEALAYLRARCEVVEATPTHGRFDRALAGARGLVVRTATRVDGRLIDSLPGLEVVGRAGVGLDTVDVDACRSRGIEVVYRPESNTRAVVEYTIGAMLAAVRPMTRLTRREIAGVDGGGLDEAGWSSLRARLMVERDLGELTLGVIGFGRIGSGVGRVARSLGMRVVFNDVRSIGGDAAHGCEAVGLEALLGMSDVVSVHVDGRAGNRGLIGAEACGLLRDGVVVINTSRGFVVDAWALAGFLRGHPRARAVVDVHEPEPIPVDNPLVGLAQATLTAHVAAGTVSARRAMGRVVEDVCRVLSGEEPEFPAPRGDLGD